MSESTRVGIGMVTIDCADPRALSQVWLDVLGTSVQLDAGEFIMLGPPPAGGPAVGLQKVPESRAGKNRVHLDLTTTDRLGEVRRIVELGLASMGSTALPA